MELLFLGRKVLVVLVVLPCTPQGSLTVLLGKLVESLFSGALPVLVSPAIANLTVEVAGGQLIGRE